jgi:hypothetical protein
LDLEASPYLERERRSIRKHFLPDGRRMSFKGLSDRRRKTALIPFLRFADHLVGVCVTMAVRKSIRHICINSKSFDFLQENLRFEGRWNPASLERMLRIVNLVGMLLGGLSKPNQNVYWISDEDQLFANPRTARDLQMMIGKYTSHYVDHPLGELGIGTTAIDPGDRFEEDLAAIPDLLAGAIAEIITAVANSAGGFMPSSGIAIKYPGSFSSKSEIICSWLSDNSHALKRPVILLEKQEKGSYSVSKFNLS